MFVFACCTEDMLPGIKQALSADFDFHYATTAAETMRSLDSKRAKLAVVEYCEGEPRDFNTLAMYLKRKGIPFVVLCHQAKDGFLVLKAGAKNMLVIPQGFYDSAKSGGKPQRRMEPIYFIESLRKIVKNICLNGDMRILKHPGLSDAHTGKVVVIGASTGGAEAVTNVLSKMPYNCPPIVVAMHMPPVFTRMFAERVNGLSQISVWEAAEGDRLHRGLALVARGDTHIELRRNAAGYHVSVMEGPPIRHVRPCVDVLFKSAAKCAKTGAVGVILTGMGSDGAEGLLDMKNAGAYTIGQDEASCVVYGMPKAAHNLGAVCVQAPLDFITRKILDNV